MAGKGGLGHEAKSGAGCGDVGPIVELYYSYLNTVVAEA